jgi:hypothetical protein
MDTNYVFNKYKIKICREFSCYNHHIYYQIRESGFSRQNMGLRTAENTIFLGYVKRIDNFAKKVNKSFG